MSILESIIGKSITCTLNNKVYVKTSEQIKQELLKLELLNEETNRDSTTQPLSFFERFTGIIR